MKIIIDIKTGKAGARTFTSVEGEPGSRLERLIYDCLHAAINVGLDNASELLAAQEREASFRAKADALAASISPPADGVVLFQVDQKKPEAGKRD